MAKLVIGLLVVFILSACGAATENDNQAESGANSPVTTENTPITAITSVPPTPTTEPPSPIPEPSATATLRREVPPTETSEADAEVEMEIQAEEEAEEEEVSEPTVTATATATEVLPVATVTEVPPTAIPTIMPTNTPIPSPTVVEEELLFSVANVENNDVLNVRAQAGVGYQIVGAIPYDGTNIEILGPSQDVNGSAWVPVRYKDIAGWVNSYYLVGNASSGDQSVGERAQEILLALKERDMATMSNMVHPDKGVRFSAYTFVRVEADAYQDADLVFSAAAMKTLLNDSTIYHWGIFDGTGDPINMTFAQYFKRFVYDADFMNPDSVGYDQMIGQGNTINNVAEVYPNATVVEYYLDGSEEYAGLDWRSLRLVLEEKDGTWYLVGIVHDEWTI